MSTEPLFLDKPIEFEKTAGLKTRLSDNTDMWEQEIVQEAYKQLPYLGRFDAHAVIDKKDEERGFAFGSIEVTPKGREPSRLNKVHIPIVVKEQMLQPLDIFIHGKRYSRLSEPRLMASLFEPESFDEVADRPPEPMIGQELFPPSVAGGYGNVGMKLGSAEMAKVVPLLPQLDGRVLKSHSERIKEATRDPDVVTAYANGAEGVQAALLSAISLGVSDATKTASALINSIQPDVVQMKKLPNGRVLVKWAAIDAYAPQQEEVPLSQAEQMAGNGQMGEQLEEEGELTAAPGAEAGGEIMPEEDTEDRVADQFGLWRVQDNMGHQLVGWVFPKVYDFNMRPLPVQLFNNGSQYAFQESIAGRVVGKATDLPKGPPQGYGALYTVKDGTAKLFLPLRVISSFQTPEGQTQYISQTDDGEQYTFYFTDMLKELTQVADGQLAVPQLYSWMPLKAETELVDDPSLLMKTASRKWSATAELRSDGSTFSWSGAAIAKLARDETKFVDRTQAAWVGALLGIRPDYMKVALDMAATGAKPVAFDGLRQPTPLAEKVAAARARVKKELSELDVPIRNYFLVKEASVLDDALMADKILGLGFINAENVATFVDMLPSLEETSSKMAELLLAVRLGVKDVPESAVERMLVSLDDVIQGLRSLKQKELRFGEE